MRFDVPGAILCFKKKKLKKLACNAPPVLRIFDNSWKTAYIGNQILVYSDSAQLHDW